MTCKLNTSLFNTGTSSFLDIFLFQKITKSSISLESSGKVQSTSNFFYKPCVYQPYEMNGSRRNLLRHAILPPEYIKSAAKTSIDGTIQEKIEINKVSCQKPFIIYKDLRRSITKDTGVFLLSLQNPIHCLETQQKLEQNPCFQLQNTILFGRNPLESDRIRRFFPGNPIESDAFFRIT